jgi:glycosyltransferase involved in cell wall biosynthesis
MEERKLGLDSYVCYTNPLETPGVPLHNLPVQILTEDQARVMTDIHVAHSHLPDGIEGKTIFIPHGTPEHCFAVAIEQGKWQGYVAGDPMMLSLYRLNNTDVTVTFWDRHQFLWKTLAPKADIRLVPMGVDLDFWKPQPIPSTGKWSGTPSLFTCENMHSIKWPLDLVLAYPIVREAVPGVVLHIHYIPMDQHRFWYPLLQANGTSYKSFTSGGYFTPENLRLNFLNVDYYVSFVRYGDFNNVCLEARAAGCKLISYKGNPYADFWIDEGDQRIMGIQLVEILRGITQPRTPAPVPSIKEMTEAMVNIYKSL